VKEKSEDNSIKICEFCCASLKSDCLKKFVKSKVNIFNSYDYFYILINSIK